ncbi:MAG TPA: DNA recombination protein RmuC [Terracidiphilus sp.]|jgi:DNA recombination protein RmuC|nr:DNA recombination protein RmuC [Terracidiphilus sp.]
MLALVVGVAAALLGTLLGYWLRSASARAEKSLLEQNGLNLAQNALNLDQRNREQAEALKDAQAALARVQAESAARAGFESVAEERERTIRQLSGERIQLQAELKTKADQASESAGIIAGLNTRLENEQKNMVEKLALLETAEKTLANQFEALAGKILDQKSKSFAEGSQKELGTLLAPLRDQITDFRAKVEKVQVESATGVTELKTLIGTLGTLNTALTTEAHNLATALRRDTKAQGNWGETILRNILDKSGLREGAHYSFQQSFTEVDSDGDPGQRRQTDVIVRLPGGRHLIIDSKVSLNAYNASVNAESEPVRAEALKKHLQSLRNHCNELAGRNYHTLYGIQSPDFVVMFVPIEPAFLLALENDDALWHDAYQRGVLLSGPTTVLFVIRIVADLWRQQDQARNVEQVMKRGAELYDKFVGFVSNLESVGGALFDARRAYDEALKQLSTGRGNLVSQVEMLRKLGVTPKGKKQIPASMLADSEFDEESSAGESSSGELVVDEPIALAAEAGPDDETGL